MCAVIKTGGKQYRVAVDDALKVEKVPGEPGDIIQFGEADGDGASEGDGAGSEASAARITESTEGISFGLFSSSTRPSRSFTSVK